jgi:hypothetical protein
MSSIQFMQTLFLRPDRQAPRLLARSAGFETAWLAEAESLILDFGERPFETFRCPPATLFAKPLTDKHVAVVRVRDDHAGSVSAHIRQGEPGFLPTGLRFHFVVVDKHSYESWIRDPFLLAAKVEPTWAAAELPDLALPAEAFKPRTVAEVQGVLRRVKAAALKEGEDPEAADFERTIENSESPVLLGAVQILVDGGRLIFARPEGDVGLVSGLWLLLPEATRVRLWPTTFAFSDALEPDVLVVPHLESAMLESYTTEEQAGDYPAGAYELALQRAAEAGDQKELDAVFSRRDSRQTIKLIMMLLIGLSLLVLASRFLEPAKLPEPASNKLPIGVQQAAGAAGIVGVGDLWGSPGMVAGWYKLRQDAEKPNEKK